MAATLVEDAALEIGPHRLTIDLHCDSGGPNLTRFLRREGGVLSSDNQQILGRYNLLTIGQERPSAPISTSCERVSVRTYQNEDWIVGESHQ